MNLKTLRVHSTGLGVQSWVIHLLELEGKIKPYDARIFSDTQWEPQSIYDGLEELKNMGVDITTVTAGDVRDFGRTDRKSTQTRFAKMPLWFIGDNQKINLLRRQCTREYKIDPVERHIRREIMKLKPRQWWPRKEVHLEVHLGITTDELGRVAQDSSKKWKTNIFPLIELGMSRDDCIEFLHERGHIARRSACIGCPFRSNEEWLDVQQNPQEWQSAIDFDVEIRHVLGDTPAFLHRSGVPLSEVNFHGENNSSLLHECSGMCNT